MNKEPSGTIRLEPSWKAALAAEFDQSYFKDLAEFVRKEYVSAKIYPPPADVFRAFDRCPFDKVKVVILGQDPYHGHGQANGLCFAVHKGVRTPPSLRNIFAEIASDIGSTPKMDDGDLSRWSDQGVLLLNATLTVRAGSPASHQGRGWERFTDAAIERLSSGREHLVFMLWGNYAKNKGRLIDRSKHLVLEAAHPSPFSAHSGFMGCKHFSQANAYLKKNGQKEIDWS